MVESIPLGLIGISHNTAPVELREKVALSVEEQRNTIQFIKKELQAKGCLVLSTCNRTEIYVSDEDVGPVLSKLRSWLNNLKGCQEFTDTSIIYEKNHADVVKHFCRVTSGLDSQIVGEQQITSQVKESYELTHQLNGTDAIINRLFNFAMQAKKQVHNETFLSDGTVSISFAGVELARKIYSNLKNKQVLLIGAGKTAELAAFHFQENGVQDINVVNRTFSKAKELADKFNGKAFSLEDLPKALFNTDIVISATTSDQYVVTEPMIRMISKERGNKPIFLIDLAVPRDIDPKIDQIESVYLFNLDDLHEIVKTNLQNRKKEIPKAQKVIEEYVYEFEQWMSTNSISNVVGKLKKKLDVLRLNELDRFKSKLPQNGHKEPIDELTESIINKVVRQHVKSLKKVADDPVQYEEQVELLRKIYDLDGDN